MTMKKGNKIFYLLALFICVVEANILDQLVETLGEKGLDVHLPSPALDPNTLPKVTPSSGTPSPTPSAPKSGPGVFDVTGYGAKADGGTENSKAFLDAWKAACSFNGDAWFVIPEGDFLLGEIEFAGPCSGKSSPSVEIRGKLKAVEDASQFPSKSWITFRGLQGLTISGGGTIDGQGYKTWEANGFKKGAVLPPASLKLASVSDSMVNGITLLNSKAFHIQVTQCNNINFYNLKIMAPEDSPNTDGIHLSGSTGIKVTDSAIGVGDDCISIGATNVDIYIANIFCGPGHGISVGSLGKFDDEQPVKNILVKNCTITQTTNGVRIKAWPGPLTNEAFNITFEDIVVNRAAFPIIINQEYCERKPCDGKEPSKVNVHDIFYKNIRGTSFTKLAVNILCSTAFPCQNVQLSDIDIAYQDPSSQAASFCSNVKVLASGKQNPPLCPP